MVLQITLYSLLQCHTTNYGKSLLNCHVTKQHSCSLAAISGEIPVTKFAAYQSHFPASLLPYQIRLTTVMPLGIAALMKYRVYISRGPLEERRAAQCCRVSPVW